MEHLFDDIEPKDIFEEKPPDLQDYPASVNEAVKKIREEGYDCILAIGKPPKFNENTKTGIPDKRIKTFTFCDTRCMRKAGGRSTFMLAVLRMILLNELDHEITELLSEEYGLYEEYEEDQGDDES